MVSQHLHKTIKFNTRYILNAAIIIFLFLSTMNFYNRQYYWLYAAFLLYIITPNRSIKINQPGIFLTILAFSMVFFDSSSRDGVLNLIKPFSFLLAYTLGYGLATRKSNILEHEKMISNIVCVCGFGHLSHYALNFIINAGNMDRDTIDIWTNSAMSATGQATLACISIGIVAAFLFSETLINHKLFAILLIGVIVVYNMVLAGRTLLLLMLIILSAALLFKIVYFRRETMKTILIMLTCLTVILILYNLNIFDIKDSIEDSNFYSRFFGINNNDILEDKRLEYKLAYLKKMFEYPFGGARLHLLYGFYAHDLYLDSYDYYGIFALFAIVFFVAYSIIHLVRFLNNSLLSFKTKQLIFCVYLAINIQFLIEPIMQSLPSLFIAYCMIDGAVSSFLSICPASEVVHEK